eukprot:m.788297 g.788297  ORF g.788297 m.788297 type:complete len:167 (-) comp59192_c1_seq12:2078-2578(-)
MIRCASCASALCGFELSLASQTELWSTSTASRTRTSVRAQTPRASSSTGLPLFHEDDLHGPVAFASLLAIEFDVPLSSNRVVAAIELFGIVCMCASRKPKRSWINDCLECVHQRVRRHAIGLTPTRTATKTFALQGLDPNPAWMPCASVTQAFEQARSKAAKALVL